MIKLAKFYGDSVWVWSWGHLTIRLVIIAIRLDEAFFFLQGDSTAVIRAQRQQSKHLKNQPFIYFLTPEKLNKMSNQCARMCTADILKQRALICACVSMCLWDKIDREVERVLICLCVAQVNRPAVRWGRCFSYRGLILCLCGREKSSKRTDCVSSPL